MTSAHELTQTYDCKVPGCTEPALANRGPKAFLCKAHAANRQSSTNGRADEGYEGKVKTLTAAGKRLDKAEAKIEAARREFELAKAAWNRAVDALGFAESPR